MRSNQETVEGKLRRPGELLDKENPIQGPCADSEEKHEPVSGVDIAVAVCLKVLDLDGRLEKRRHVGPERDRDAQAAGRLRMTTQARSHEPTAQPAR